MSTILEAKTKKQQQVIDKLLAQIDVMAVGARLPGERQLSEILQVSRQTIRNALQHIQELGWVDIRVGAGVFVARPPLVSQLKLMSFTEAMRARGLHPSSQILSVERIEASSKIAQRMQLSPGATMHHIRRLRLADGQPVAIESVYLPLSRFPELALSELKSGSLYEILEQQYELVIEHANEQISATVVNQQEAERLQIAAYSPALLVTREVIDNHGEVIEYAKSLYRADKYRFDVHVHRSGTTLAFNCE